MKLSLKNRFLLPTTVLIIIGMGLAGLISSVGSKNALKTAYTGQISQITDSTVKVIDAWINDRILDVGSWSREKIYQTALKDSFVGKAARKSANVSLARLKDDYKYYENICLADVKGELVSAADPSVIGKVKVMDREYFQKSINGEVFISGVFRSKGTQNPVFVISVPVKENNEINGVIFGVVDTSYFNDQFISPIRIGETGYAYLIKKDGTVIAHPDEKQIMNLNMKDFDFGREMMTKKEGWITYTYNGVEKIANYRPSKRLGWTLSVGAVTSEFYAPVKRLTYINGCVAFAVVALAVAIILLLVRSIVNPINRISNGLHKGSDQVAQASLQVSSSSQSLAEGASEQAASIEETSSSLEEMSSMTKQNAGNATQADNLMKEANKVVSKANTSMGELTHSMEEISRASEETSKIIKTIDEIAFQTNLLALNAAVEAARAGEAGAGFAVVADEVRNLAMRAAEAARNTADLIEGTVKKVKDGGDLVATTNEAFGEVAKSAAKVGELVAEIAAASNEQAQGIGQVNTAVAEMDKVVQQNAASAEESASASEEMNAQAGQMKNMVDELVALVGGNRNGKISNVPDVKKIKHVVGWIKNQVNHNKSESIELYKDREVKPEEVIPIEEKDFEDF